MTIPQIVESVHGESRPLLAGKLPRKPFYRARPLWLVPFAVTASLTRGMTLAPRLEVFTQLSCNNLYGHHEWNRTQSPISSFSSSYAPIDPLGPHFHPYAHFPESRNLNDQLEINPGMEFKGNRSDSDDAEDPFRIPSARCLSDPAVQAGAARLQTILTTTMGLLSALTTSWWGHFSERHGRTRVLALSSLGLLLTDLIYILVSIPSSPLSKHGHKFLLLSPIIEGLLGGYLTLQSATSAYLSDCTSSGSRAHIFSRFTGAVSLGISAGPALGGWLIRHPIPWIGGSSTPRNQTVTSVFWTATLLAFINFTLMAFVFPESLDKEERKRAMIAYQKLGAGAGKKGKARERALTLSSGDPGSSRTDQEDGVEDGNRPKQDERESGLRSGGAGIISRLLSPLAVFLPVMVPDPSGLGRKRRDWSLTLLAGALFAHMLSTGVNQMKYLYAGKTYGWGAEQLSYYISYVAGSRAIFLLFLLPTIISFVKPKPLPLPPHGQKGKGEPPTSSDSSQSSSTIKPTSSAMNQQPQPEQQQQPPLQKPKPSRAQLGQEIGFDLLLTRFSLMIDILSHTLVILFPAPILKVENQMSLMQSTRDKTNFAKSQAMFVIASSLTSVASGVVPAVHSLALCVLQARALDAAASADGEDENVVETREEGNGALFGAFAVLQAIGQTILSPVIFGLIYSGTVAKFPKAIFTVAAGFLVYALALVFCVRNPARLAHPGRPKGKNNKGGRDVERGRSTVRKDLRGGAIVNYGSDGSYDSERSS